MTEQHPFLGAKLNNAIKQSEAAQELKRLKRYHIIATPPSSEQSWYIGERRDAEAAQLLIDELKPLNPGTCFAAIPTWGKGNAYNAT